MRTNVAGSIIRGHDFEIHSKARPGDIRASDAVAQAFRDERERKHGEVVKSALAILRTRFAQVGETEGYRKDGPVAVAKLELGESDEPEQREARALRQREASDVIEQLLARIG